MRSAKHASLGKPGFTCISSRIRPTKYPPTVRVAFYDTDAEIASLKRLVFLAAAFTYVYAINWVINFALSASVNQADFLQIVVLLVPLHTPLLSLKLIKMIAIT